MMIGEVPPEKGMCDRYVIKLREGIEESIDKSRLTYEGDVYKLKSTVLNQLDVRPWISPDIALNNNDAMMLEGFRVVFKPKKEGVVVVDK